MSDTLLLTYPRAGVAVITFNRPHAMNALNSATMHAFAAAVRQLSTDDALRCVVLTGAGDKAFCAGGDLAELRDKPSAAEGLAMVTLVGDTLLALERLPVPVIAAVNGYALGGGSEIALACDLRVADVNVRMGFVQINMALTPGWGAGQRLLRAVGYARALEILLEGQPMGAETLQGLGLVNRITSAGHALDEALTFAERVANRPPDVVRAIKQLLQTGLHARYEDALAAERALFPPLWEAPAHLQAVEDFFARQASKRA